MPWALRLPQTEAERVDAIPVVYGAISAAIVTTVIALLCATGTTPVLAAALLGVWAASLAMMRVPQLLCTVLVLAVCATAVVLYGSVVLAVAYAAALAAAELCGLARLLVAAAAALVQLALGVALGAFGVRVGDHHVLLAYAAIGLVAGYWSTRALLAARRCFAERAAAKVPAPPPKSPRRSPPQRAPRIHYQTRSAMRALTNKDASEAS